MRKRCSGPVAAACAAVWAFVWVVLLACVQAGAQNASGKPLPEFIRKAQTVHVPLFAVARTAAPVNGLSSADLTVDVDGKPHAFELSRPWDRTIHPKTGQAQDRPNLLIMLPVGTPIERKTALEHAIADLGRQPEEGWNVSILDDSGDQTAYTRDLKSVVASLQTIEKQEPEDLDLDGWRSTAAVAIASMRDLPGRRVVLTLGDVFHEMMFDEGELVYNNFEVDDLADAARNAGAIIYAADSTGEVNSLRGLYPYFYMIGNGPYLLITEQQHIAGWITGTISDAWNQIRRDGAGAYDVDLHLDPKQMDGQMHAFSVTSNRQGVILDTPAYYIAPSLPQLRSLALAYPALRAALKSAPPPNASPLELATQLAYFPHPDGQTGTQIATTGFFWTQDTPPPKQLQVALQLEQSSSGFLLSTTVGDLTWTVAQPVWNVSFEVSPGAYLLRVAAANATGSIRAAADTPFTVEPAQDDAVLISSLVIGKSCTFAPPVNTSAAGKGRPDYLRAGNCDLAPDPGHYYSPQDVIWALVRITPTGKLTRRPAKDWKPTFEIVNAKGQKLTEQAAPWLPAPDGSLVASAALPLGDPKLNLVDGEYAVMFRLKGPGIERGYGEDAPFLVYGAGPAPEVQK